MHAFSFINFSRAVIASVAFTLLVSACGGGGDTELGDTFAPEGRLSGLLITGFDVSFDPAVSSGYSIDVSSEVSSIELIVEAESQFDLSYQAFTARSTEVGSGSLVSGQASNIAVFEGQNTLNVIVGSDGASSNVTYTVQINREGASASIDQFAAAVTFIDDDGMAFSDDGAVISRPVVLVPEFSPDTTSYSIVTDDDACRLFYGIELASPGAVITSNEQVIRTSGESLNQTQALQPGENALSLNVVSENGMTTNQYEFTITRPEQSTLLESIAFSSTQNQISCESFFSAVAVNQIDKDQTVTITPQSAGANVRLFTFEEVDGVSERVEVPLSLTFSADLSLSDGANPFEVEVRNSAASEDVRTYVVSLIVLDNNVYRVETPEALQEALLAVVPGDEIIVAGQDIVGLMPSEEGGSGVETAHFYTDVSGTAEQPIFLSAETSLSRLSGVSEDGLAVIQLDGDFWVLRNLTVTTAKYGLVLNGASNNILSSLVISDIGSQGIVIQNGSNDNLIVSSTFSAIGENATVADLPNADAIVVGSESETWHAAGGGSGTFEPLNNDNLIRGNGFLSSNAGQVIDVKEGAQRTRIEYNAIAVERYSADQSDTFPINILGNDSLIRFNRIVLSDSSNASALINVSSASVDGWGQGTRVFDNVFGFASTSVPAITADDALVVEVTGNRDLSEAALMFSGALIASEGINSSLFEIKVNPEFGATEATVARCLTVDSAQNESEDYDVLLQACTEKNTSQTTNAQLWKIELSNGGDIQLVNSQLPDLYLRAGSDAAAAAAADNPAISASVSVSSSDRADIWQQAFIGDRYGLNFPTLTNLVLAVSEEEGSERTILRLINTFKLTEFEADRGIFDFVEVE